MSGMRIGMIRRRTAVAIGVFAAGAALLVSPLSGSAPAAQSPQLQGFHLVAAHSNKSADISGGSLSNGATVVQWPQNSLNSQGWVGLPFGPAVVFVNLNSGKVLDVAGSSQAGGANQVWGGVAVGVPSSTTTTTTVPSSSTTAPATTTTVPATTTTVPATTTT